METQTKTALAKFTNDQDFKRMCIDLLKALNYEKVELKPLAKKHAITFLEGVSKGVALDTLGEDTVQEFKDDLTEILLCGPIKIIFFTNREISANQRKKLFALVNATEVSFLEIYDLKRIKSLLDNRFTDIRTKYLKI